ncbi:MAG TPA: UvrD-helicase domain-containing protein, partial [Candidatus Ozemobacteraceae bacterium]|nr:UvrD-helicase domain-containing protein [Candidatus Ozemobacteraceae bacterium]
KTAKVEKTPELWWYSGKANDPAIDDEVKAIIRERLDLNLLIEAVPGSGKTYNLVQRMISLILARHPANQIAAITFTRKAAEELRSRFREQVESRIGSSSGEERTLLEQALLAIEDGYIGTIHGFCSRILREYPIEAQLDPSFIELEEGQDVDLFKQAWIELIGRRADWVAIFSDHGLDPMDSIIVKGLKRFCEFPDADFSVVDKPPAPDPKPLLQAFEELWKTTVAYDPRPRMSEDEKRENNELMMGWVKYDRTKQSIQSFLGLQTFSPNDLKALWRALRYMSRTVMRTDDKNANEALKESCGAVVKLADAFAAAYAEYVFPAILPLLNGLRDAEREWRNRRGFVSFLDLLSRTVQLLKNQPVIREAVSRRYPVLLVDEYQDTDPFQAQMVFLLTATDSCEKDWMKCVPKPGSLFLVGDPKQSVYRFRRADIQVYRQTAEHLKRSGGQVLTLKHNRRSLSSLCEWVNRAFAPVFQEQQQVGQAPFAEMFPMRASEGKAAVYAYQIPDSIRGNATRKMCEHDAAAFAGIVASMLGRSFPNVNDGRPLQPDDVLILCRKNDLLVLYAKELEARGIPTNLSGGGKELASTLQKEFEPLYWLLRALAECTNAAVVWAVLVGAFFGVSDEEMWEYVRSGGRLNCAFPPDGDSSVARALCRLAQYRRWMQDEIPGTAFRRIVHDLGYDAHLQISEHGLMKTTFLGDVERLFDNMLFSDAVDTLGVWITNWPVDRKPDEPGRVRIMTIHKAKGLEAP